MSISVITPLDLSQVYQQVLLDDESKKFITVNIQKGLFRYTHLRFRIASAPGIIQRVTEGILQGNDNVVLYLDQSLISRSMEESHLGYIDEVLLRFNGARPLQDNVKAI